MKTVTDAQTLLLLRQINMNLLKLINLLEKMDRQGMKVRTQESHA